jgi:hypothetical protein
VLAALAAVLAGCNLDTEAGHAKIVNDMPYAVKVMLCEEDDCGKPGFPFFFQDRYHNPFNLKPGETAGYVNVASDGVPNVYRVVRSSDDRELGCLPFVMPKLGPDLVAKVSQRVPCRGGWNEDVRWPS